MSLVQQPASSFSPSERGVAARALSERHPIWYHKIELAPGVITPGFSDAEKLARLGLPGRLDGFRCLDVATFDGYYAFEMERRGAEAVIAIDIDSARNVEHPPLRRADNLRELDERPVELGRTWHDCAAWFGSSAVRKVCNVYDLSLETTDGPVDFVMMGNLLQHLRDPVRALERVHDVLRPGGRALLVEQIDVWLSILRPTRPAANFRCGDPSNRFNWWIPNITALKHFARAASLVPESRLPKVQHFEGGSRLFYNAGLLVRRLD